MLKAKHAIAAALIAGLSLMVAATAQAAPINDFTGPYDVSNWTRKIQGDGSIDVSGAPSSVILTGPNDGSGVFQDVDFTITAVASGTVSFTWNYTTFDNDGPAFDPFEFLINGVFNPLSNAAGGANQSSFSMFPVLAGDVFGFRQWSTDSTQGFARTTISGFRAPGVNSVPVPAPTTIALFGLGLAGFGLMRRRRLRLRQPHLVLCLR